MDEVCLKLTVCNKHLLINTEQGLILIDTGSPTSFHKDGFINIGDTKISVPESFMGVDHSYISEKVGCEVSGLLGMDIMKGYYIRMIDANVGIFEIAGDHFVGSDVPVKGANLLMGCPCFEMTVGNREIKMILDTGAPVSYINKKFTQGIEVSGQATDFSPLLGIDRYTVDLHPIPVVFEDSHFDVQFGDMPESISFMLGMLGVDGIIGYDLFCRFRFGLNNGIITFPSQL